jgi:lipid II:glycine glycyltransferase (peptidoglycan interpeptide bridge formation enzyme)
MSVTIDQDLKDILNKLDQRFDKLEQKLETIQKDTVDLKIGQTDIRGELKTLDTKCDQIEKRISNQEFYNRGILSGLILIILGSAIKFFGFFPKA